MNMPPQENRYITPEDLYTINLILDSQISPDGSHVAYCVQRVVKKKEKKYSNFWMIPTAGGSPRQFTSGDQSDTQPRWSPDGTLIAFMSNRDDEKQPQLYLIPVHGGEARKLTDLKGTFEEFTWSPDGKKIVFVFRKKDKEDIEREEDSEKKDLGIVSRHITRVFFKEDGQGYLPGERKHIWVVTIDTGELVQLTEGDIHDETQPSWSPDGKSIVFCSNRTKDPDLDPDAIDLFMIPADGGDLKKIETPVGPKSFPRFSPDGTYIAYFGHEGKHVNWKVTGLWIVPPDGGEKSRNLTERWDINVGGFTINDLPGTLPGIPPEWSPDSKTLYFQVSHHGTTGLQSVSLNGGEMVSVIDNPGVVGACTFDSDHSHIAYLYGDMKDPGQVWVFDLQENTAQQLSHVNEDLLQSIVFGEVEEVWFTGPDGNDLQGWILTPPDFDRSKMYPSILEIHGGPRTQYGNTFMHEFHVLAAQGYVVYFCNPRGSQGYGEEHSHAILNRWGTVDYADIMSWVDTVEKKPYIDTKRMGVTGGSYGGYMTNWIIGHTHRFSAAVTQRSVSNFISMYGSSDFNWAFEEEFGNEPPWENNENYWEQSPLKYIGNCTTPTLVIHSEQDMRCDPEQGLQIFVALKRMGIETELVLFPEEPHGLSRGGRTDRRISRLQHMICWFNTYLT
jgi:dipeptidyl aminopeptidase/acylaminoacyl peptidase